MTRRSWAIATISAASLFGASFTAVAVFNPLPRVVWNASASAPIGFYRIEPSLHPPHGALVAVTPPAPLARWLAERGYLGERVPLLKHVAARPGQQVCRIGAVVSVDAQRDVIAGAFSSLVPACADLRAFAAIAAMDPPVRRLVGVARLGRHDGDADVERRRLDDAFVAAGGTEKAADLHGTLLRVGRDKRVQRHASGAFGVSRVRIGIARPSTVDAGSGPK